MADECNLSLAAVVDLYHVARRVKVASDKTRKTDQFLCHRVEAAIAQEFEDKAQAYGLKTVWAGSIPLIEKHGEIFNLI